MNNRNEYIENCKKENQQVLGPKFLVQYLRDKHGRPVGLALAYKQNDEVKVGWSKCNTTLENFDKQIGINKAINNSVELNSVKFVQKSTEIPNSLRYTVTSLVDRASRYYKI